MFDDFSILTLTLFLPIIGMTVLLFMRDDQENEIKWTAFGFTIATFLVSLLVWAGFDNSVPGLQMVQQWTWIQFGDFTINYYVGVDGLSLILILLSTFIMPLAVLSSFDAHVIHERGRSKLYYMFMLLMEWAMLGVFMAQDLFVFYVFWEVSLVPMYFLIGIWGGDERRYASIKFFLYTMAGSLLMLIAILYIGNQAGTFTLAGEGGILAQLQSGLISFPATQTGLGGVQGLLFLGFFIAFAIKVPVWPLHSWLPDAHVQAPTAGSVILAGVLLKMGTYGIVRFCLPLFPQASVYFAPAIGVLAVIGIIYGAWVSYAQTDVKKLVAYSSISHLGFVILGIFALNQAGITGGTLQMVNHGISTGGLFLLVGMLYERRHTRALDAFGGIWKAMPVYGGISLIVVLSSMGLPGLNGFVGEFTILLGSYGSVVLGAVFTFFATTGVILAAIYMLHMFQKVYLGELDKEENKHLEPLTWKELAVIIPIIIMIFWIGLYPKPFLATMDSTANTLITETINPALPAPAEGEGVASAITVTSEGE
ncbi:MAG: complex I subunit 4 family protein [Phototrophicaceae bacterium]|jgi:NADH-quinone oxidoreductase subunit M